MANSSMLPQILQDKTNLALEECINESLNIDLSKIMTCMPDNLQNSVLSSLAAQYHILSEGWNDCKTRDEKISLLKRAIKLHRYKATVKAIKECINSEDIKSDYIPWFNYDGLPHHFKIKLYLDGISYSQEIKNTILKKIEEYKQLRAKLDKTEIMHLVTSSLAIKQVPIITRRIII